ncbi:gamma-aminobutyric acid receptor subunit alpha-2 [Drosophila rhopaloa]|uniref:Gamma-aminobutyric acid receptor subunit alpha-2 n=1 Tax=Drosophila rhopaloa TaxID=1041015 RepID=A0A6P4ED07_DRORH|nr:gamma-aminobutyric acid receptor subunit alpha-2 [Drosophila rhopaloa]
MFRKTRVLLMFSGLLINICVCVGHVSDSPLAPTSPDLLYIKALGQTGILTKIPNITSEFSSRIFNSFRVLPSLKQIATRSTTRRQSPKNIAYFSELSNRRRVPRKASADMLSRNISMILENLLKRYEQSQLPTHGQGVPTVVQTNILIRSMGPVSELDMDYSMDCYFRQYWRDKRLSFKGPIKSLSLSIKMLDKIWRPDTYFYNGKHSQIHMITVPNKLLRLDQNGGILYSMRLTIKATCPMELQNFPMDRQSCPLVIGSYGYINQQLIYEWKNQDDAVSFVPGMTLNQFDLISMMHRNFTTVRREGDFSVLHVAFNLKRHTGYFLIQVYVPCILIVVLSWVSFWIHREATSDRVSLCVTSVLTLSTISLDSRTDLPKVKYATALDWFLLMSFLYCIATLLEFAGVHYFTKLGSGESPQMEEQWEDICIANELSDHAAEDADQFADEEDTSDGTENDENEGGVSESIDSKNGVCVCKKRDALGLEYDGFLSREAIFCPTYNNPSYILPATMESTTQTEPPAVSRLHQMWMCLKSDNSFRKQRERNAAAQKSEQGGANCYVNSVSLIDRVARVAFPMSFAFLNLLYWLTYGMYKKEFSWSNMKA